jgi:type VII secretion integral membrane protein EccD
MNAPTDLARVTINAPHRRVDVALPEHVPLVELLPDLVRHAGEGLADDGERHGGWVLRRADGTALAPAQGLSAQGVRDGEVLHLVPARAEWPELEYDDVVEAIAAGARRQGAAWSPEATTVATSLAAGAPLVAGLVAVVGRGPEWTMGAYVSLGAAAVLLLAAVVASRAYGNATTATALGVYALPYAFAGGTLVAATADRVGVFGAFGWLGESQLLVGCAWLMLAAVLAIAGIGAGRPIFSAGITTGLLGGLTALAGTPLSASGAAALLVVVLVCGVGVIPLLAIRFGKLPLPPVTLPTGRDATDAFRAGGTGSLDAMRERPERARMFAAVFRTEELLTGMIIALAVLGLAGAAVLVVAGGFAGRLLVGVAGVALVLRSRMFVSVRHRVPLVAAGVGALVVLAVGLVFDATERELLGAVVAAVGLALVTVAAGATYSRRPPSPYLVRAADITDTVLVISVVPVACAVLGLYDQIRGLAG